MTVKYGTRMVISIHAPRGGSDFAILLYLQIKLNFNPRSPRGERHLDINGFVQGLSISIHAPRGGSDRIVQKVQ